MKNWIIYDAKYENTITSIGMLEKAKDYGLDSELYFFQYFSYVNIDGKTNLYYKNKQITKLPDIAFIRGYDYDIHNFLHNNNVKFVNDMEGTLLTRDKFKMHEYVGKMGIKQPKTITGNNLTYKEICKLLNDKVFVMKDRYGMRGDNVFLIHNEEEFLNAKSNTNINFIYQQYIEDSKGHDLRLYIVGGKVFGPIERYSITDDFRSNISQGGDAKLFQNLPIEITEKSIKLTQSLGLNFCSIDYLLSKNEFYFCEANANAAFSVFFNFEIDLQSQIMKYLASLE